MTESPESGGLAGTELAGAELGRAEPSDAELGRLKAGLAAKAENAGLLDVAYRTLDTPVGELLLAATPAGLVRVAYEREDFDKALDVLAARISARVLQAPRRLDTAARQLEEYFTGRRRLFELPVDLSLASGFRRSVLGYLPQIGYGHTSSYGAVAAALDHPRAARAVGTACATNPLPLVIPCHRVVRSDGQIGAYLAGAETKERLLELEAEAGGWSVAR